MNYSADIDANQRLFFLTKSSCAFLLMHCLSVCMLFIETLGHCLFVCSSVPSQCHQLGNDSSVLTEAMWQI